MIGMAIKSFMVLFVIGLTISGITYAAGNPPFPILVLATDNHFGSYTAEILKAEGFNEFEIHPLTDTKVTLRCLKGFDIVILAETVLSEAQEDMLGRYVKEGGSLIAFKPDKKLNDVFGIATTGGVLDEAYILIDTHTEIGNGITTQTLQFHGEADEVDLKGGKSIAALYNDAATSTVYPAVVVNDYGGGLAVALFLNLAENIGFSPQRNLRPDCP